MIVFLYTIQDIIAQENGPVFTAKNDAVAMRNYNALLNDVPEIDKNNYKLYRVAEFNTESIIPFVEAENPGKLITINVNMEAENAEII